ncbi:uncharacterized protein LOC129745545 [Uranotaenia lowii]|uniref:uncharacterized protein LOC129745545 n=1 Tax=Uranotaenia lowii TaxID=190385 RepID=UPI002478720F|nr:uncharacterized protein LOC129745545 [Uranotaenia lowii]XP_055594647.1 uncharacterized protein LOC129745545 [Uranotaenia lowii]
MSLTTTMDPYIPGSIPFAQYIEQLEWIFIHHNYKEEQYKASFLAICGQEVYSKLKLLFPGRNIKEISYHELTAELTKSYDKSDSDVVHSYNFWSRRQGNNEKNVDFVLSVKFLAELCNFGDFKQRAIRDVLVMGIKDPKLRKKLFDEEDLTAVKAEKIIVNQELAWDRTQKLENSETNRVSVVARLGRNRDYQPNKSSYRSRSRSSSFNRSASFSEPRDERGNNKFRTKPVFLCTFCNRKGHTKAYCYRRKNKSPRVRRSSVKFVDSPKSTSSGLFKRLKKDLQSDSEEDLSCMKIASINKINEPCYIDVLVENKFIKMELDCGSAESVISEKQYLKYFKFLSLKQCSKRLVVIDGKRLNILGRVDALVILNGSQHRLSLVILRCDNDFVPLMGRSWMDVFYAGWRDTFIKPQMSDETIHALKDMEMVEEIKSFPGRTSHFGAQTPVEGL